MAHITERNHITERKRKTKNPCVGCGLSENFCICHYIIPTQLNSKLSLIIHHRETKRTTNTGLIATRALSNSDVTVRGLREQPVNLIDTLDSEYQPLLLYPSSCAVELTQSLVQKYKKPIQLLVPDGNWRQASKVHYRHKEISEVPRVFVSKPNNLLDTIRKESKEIGMPTLLSIALAFGILEGPETGEYLHNICREKVKNTTLARGLHIR